MTTEYFYLILAPTSSNAPYIISKSFSISYSMDIDLARQQSAYEAQFRAFNNNPLSYNPQWSVGFNDKTTADKERKDEIKLLQVAGHIVQTPDWP